MKCNDLFTTERFVDNAGWFHLAVTDEDGACVYYLCTDEEEIMLEALEAVRDGEDPREMDGGEDNPQALYDELQESLGRSDGNGPEDFDDWESHWEPWQR